MSEIPLSATGEKPTFVGRVPIQGPDVPATLHIGLQCIKMPTDGYIAMDVPGPDPQNSIYYPKSRILQSNMTIMFKVHYPAGFKTEMTYYYFEGATKPPPGSSLTPFIGTEEGNTMTRTSLG